MNITYSQSEAKSRFSEILALVSSGQTVSISHNGKTIAEIRQPERQDENLSRTDEEGFEDRLAELERRGVLVRSGKRWKPVHAGDPMPGAVERFLAER